MATKQNHDASNKLQATNRIGTADLGRYEQVTLYENYLVYHHVDGDRIYEVTGHDVVKVYIDGHESPIDMRDGEDSFPTEHKDLIHNLNCWGARQMLGAGASVNMWAESPTQICFQDFEGHIVTVWLDRSKQLH